VLQDYGSGFVKGDEAVKLLLHDTGNVRGL
jgi:hypothetical protein